MHRFARHAIRAIAPSIRRKAERCYFNRLDIEEKALLSFVPSPFTTVMIAIPAAITPYCMAVAAASSLRNALINIRIKGSYSGRRFCGAVDGGNSGMGLMSAAKSVRPTSALNQTKEPERPC